MAPFGWGIIGFGWVARSFVAPAIDAAGGQALIAIADPGQRARDAAASLGIPAHAAIADLLRHRGIDAIYVATPNHLHREAVEQASHAGKPILCEKPLAADLLDAHAIENCVRAQGTFLRTAMNQRHHPAHRAIRDAIRDGRIGTVTAVRIVYACWLDADWQPEAGPADNWRIDRARAGGGALIDLAPHGLDLASFLLDETITGLQVVLQRRVQAYDVDDGAMVACRTCSGVLISLHVAYNHPETLPRRRLEVLGTTGMITADNTMGQDPGGTVTLLPAQPDAGPIPLAFDAEASPFREQLTAFADAVQRNEDGSAALARDIDLFRQLVDASERARCH